MMTSMKSAERGREVKRLVEDGVFGNPVFNGGACEKAKVQKNVVYTHFSGLFEAVRSVKELEKGRGGMDQRSHRMRSVRRKELMALGKLIAKE